MFNALAHTPLAGHLLFDLSPNNSPSRPPENVKRPKLSKRSTPIELGLKAPFHWVFALLIYAEPGILALLKRTSNTS
jgi:hypothetical protein